MSNAAMGVVLRAVAWYRLDKTDARLFAEQWDRQLRHGIVRAIGRRRSLLAGAPRFVTGAVQDYLSEAYEFGQVCQEQDYVHKSPHSLCECDDDGPCAACTVDERCKEQMHVMRRARRRAADVLRRWLAGEWSAVGPAEPMPSKEAAE